MPQYLFKNNFFFSIWGGQHTTPADPGLPKPPCHHAHCIILYWQKSMTSGKKVVASSN